MHPEIIQGGMGVGVSSWSLARTVAKLGQMGVVSGTALDTTLVRRLIDGDPGGHLRRAMESFPVPGFVAEVLDRFFREGGREPDEPYPLLPLYKRPLDVFRQKLLVLANFVEVYLAREGHDGAVGINYLHKIQMPTLPSLYGAMLAGVGYVLMGAGIPRDVPGALDELANHRPAAMRLEVAGGGSGDDAVLSFDPVALWPDLSHRPLHRPTFLAIVSSDSLATMLARKANGTVDGFVIEGHTAGGHNAPPRRGGTVNARGEPVYGHRDRPDLTKIARLGRPFWLAGGMGTPERLREAKEAGAAGIQVGTLFAYARESGLREDLRHQVLDAVREGGVSVLTDGRASPTGFPFKIVALAGSASEAGVYEARTRVCDLGYLRAAYRTGEGRIGYRCPAEPIATYVKNGGAEADTVGRKCLCNALLADIGMAQVREGGSTEPPLVTSGDHVTELRTFLGGRTSYGAVDVIDYLLQSSGPAPSAHAPAPPARSRSLHG